MGVSVSLTTTELTVEPGESLVCAVAVANTGTVVDHLELDVVGDAAAWAAIEPAALNLFPGEEEVVELVFDPPRSADVVAGQVHFGVRVVSQEDAQGSFVEEGVVTVAAFTELDAELVPRTSHARRTASHELAVDNHGNNTAMIQVFADDPDDELKIRVEPPAFEALPGTATFVRVKVRPRRRFLRGPNRTLPFHLHVTGGGQTVDVEGTVLQEQVLPRWLLPAVLAAAAGALTLLVLYLTVLRPNVNTAARDAAALAAKSAVESQRAEFAPTLAAARSEASAAKQDAAQAEELAEVAAKAAGVDQEVIASIQENPAPDGDSGDSGDPAPVTGGLATDFRIQTSVQPGRTGTAARVVEDGRVLAVTDIILQNPGGDTGTLELRRGDAVLLRVNLENFRDLDYHFVRPIEFVPGSRVVLAVDCRNTSATPCSAAAYFTGNTRPAG